MGNLDSKVAFERKKKVKVGGDNRRFQLDRAHPTTGMKRRKSNGTEEVKVRMQLTGYILTLLISDGHTNKHVPARFRKQIW